MKPRHNFPFIFSNKVLQTFLKVVDLMGRLIKSVYESDFEQLRCQRYEEYNGVWYVINRQHFDLFMLEEPYTSLVMLVNINSAEYIFRVLGVTRYYIVIIELIMQNGYVICNLFRERGYFSNADDLQTIISTKFFKTVACVGNPKLRATKSVNTVRILIRFLKVSNNINLPRLICLSTCFNRKIAR